MFSVILLAIALVGAGVTIIVRQLKGVDRIDHLAGWLLACPIGLGGVWAFIGHAFFPVEVAHTIGWATSPFQWEIAMANLGIGVLGLLCIVFRDRFRLAVALLCNIYLLGCAVGHIRQMIEQNNFSVNNAGPILWIGDILVPILILVLVVVGEVRRRHVSEMAP